jgi:hypothetical protein
MPTSARCGTNPSAAANPKSGVSWIRQVASGGSNVVGGTARGSPDGYGRHPPTV